MTAPIFRISLKATTRLRQENGSQRPEPAGRLVSGIGPLHCPELPVKLSRSEDLTISSETRQCGRTCRIRLLTFLSFRPNLDFQ
jgi:hypothetical protein